MDKATLTKTIIKIYNMNNRELNEQAVTVSMSNVDDKARYFLNKAIDKRREELEQAISPYVVSSEIDSDAY